GCWREITARSLPRAGHVRRRLAHHGKRHADGAAKKAPPVSADSKAPPVAYHEAGHAVFAWHFEAKLSEVWIKVGSIGQTVFDDEPTDPQQLGAHSYSGRSRGRSIAPE